MRAAFPTGDLGEVAQMLEIQRPWLGHRQFYADD
jgi:hypothetical protein